MKTNFLKPLVVTGMASMAILCSSFTASATIMIQLDTGNAAIGGYTGPYAEASVTRNSDTTATIVFTSLTNSGNIYLFGGNSAVDFNVNAASWTLDTLSGTNAGTGFTPGPLSDDGQNNVDGHGNFNQTIDSFDGFTHSSDTITIDLTNTGGTWADDEDVLIANGSGYRVAAHIFVTADPANASNGALVTGYAAGGPTVDDGGDGGDGGTPIPEPGTLALFGFGLAGLGFARRRKSA